MPEINFSHPLKVPEGVTVTPKSQKRYDSGFSPSLTLDEAINYLQEECAKLPPDCRVTVFTNYDKILSPRLRKRTEDDSSALMLLAYKQRKYQILSHVWGLTEHNLYALHLAIRSFTNLVRWGICDFGTAIAGFTGPQAATAYLAAPLKDEHDLISRGQWLAILRLDEESTLEDANNAYRYYAKKAAKSEEALLRLNQAIEAARDYYAKYHPDEFEAQKNKHH